MTLSASDNAFGLLLKHWRSQRNFSQLALSMASDVSQRHISFIESGRSHPSRDMVLRLATVLDIPLRQQNKMLTAAGFAPIYSEFDFVCTGGCAHPPRPGIYFAAAGTLPSVGHGPILESNDGK